MGKIGFLGQDQRSYSEDRYVLWSRLDHPQSYWMMKQAPSGFQASSYSHLSCFYAISTLVCDVVHFASHSVKERVLMLIDYALSARIHPLVKIVLY